MITEFEKSDGIRECNTCKHYEPFGMVCTQDGEERKPHHNPCRLWVDWEEGEP